MIKPLSVKVVKGMKPCDKKLKEHLRNVLAMTYDGPSLGKYVYVLPGDICIFLPTRTALNEMKHADWAVATLEDGSCKVIGIAPDISHDASQRLYYSYKRYNTFYENDFLFVYHNGTLYVITDSISYDAIKWLKLIPYKEAQQ